jgi:hypothetical protein
MVPAATENDNNMSLSSSSTGRSTNITRQSVPTTPTEKKSFSCVPYLWQQHKEQGLSDDVTEIILHSWRNTTIKQYKSYFQKWMSFCVERDINSISPNVNNIYEFFGKAL